MDASLNFWGCPSWEPMKTPWWLQFFLHCVKLGALEECENQTSPGVKVSFFQVLTDSYSEYSSTMTHIRIHTTYITRIHLNNL